MESQQQDQSSQTLISDEDVTGLIQSDKGKTPESGLSVFPRSLSSTVVGPGVGQTQTSSNSTGLNLERPRTVQDVAAGRSSKTKKLKATASMATWLRIGLWEKKEIYVGDVVGRCYYCSQKLAWEVTEDGWKSKIECGWSKIIGMQAIVDDGCVTLNLELKEPPTFYVEEQVFKAKKQTTWLKSADFTEGCQASTFRMHSIRFKAGVFFEVYNNLLNSDTRLLALTQKPFPTLNSPFFDDSSIVLSNGNPFSAAAHSLPFFPISSPSLHPSNLTQLPPQSNQQLRFSSPSSSQLAPLLPQPNQHFPISSSFPMNLTPLPLQPIPPLQHWPIDDSSIESSHWRNEFGSSTYLTPMLPPLRMSLSNPDIQAPLPLQINQQHPMNQHLHQIIDPVFHPISENVLPKQTVGSSSSMTDFADGMLDFGSTTDFADGMLDFDWLLDVEEDAKNVESSSGHLWDVVSPVINNIAQTSNSSNNIID